MKVLVLTSEPITAQQLRDALGDAGVSATGDTGESDLETAIEDALKTFDADRIVLFTHRGDDQRYREDLDDRELAERFGRPVDHAGV
jgi:hypothetical protein